MELGPTQPGTGDYGSIVTAGGASETSLGSPPSLHKHTHTHTHTHTLIHTHRHMGHTHINTHTHKHTHIQSGGYWSHGRKTQLSLKENYSPSNEIFTPFTSAVKSFPRP